MGIEDFTHDEEAITNVVLSPRIYLKMSKVYNCSSFKCLVRAPQIFDEDLFTEDHAFLTGIHENSLDLKQEESYNIIFFNYNFT